MPIMNAVVVSGGLLKNTAYMQIQADVLGVEVIGMECGKIDMMLVGTAIMAYQAARRKPLTLEAMSDITFCELKLSKFTPNLSFQKYEIFSCYPFSSFLFRYHEIKYRCYKEFVQAGTNIQKLMAELD